MYGRERGRSRVNTTHYESRDRNIQRQLSVVSRECHTRTSAETQQQQHTGEMPAALHVTHRIPRVHEKTTANYDKDKAMEISSSSI